MKEITYKIETAKDGNPVPVININGRDIPLHSRINPLKEGEKTTYKAEPERYDFLIILGCGMGYYYTGLKGYSSGYRAVIIIDVLKDIEKQIVKNPHTSFLIVGNNISFLSGLETDNLSDRLTALINFQEIRGIQVIEHPQSVRLFQGYYDEVKSIIKKIVDKKAADKATIKAFGSLFLRNALNNLQNFRECSPVSVLAGGFSGRKAVIVSSAPSLEDNICKLRQYKDSVYIIAVDSVIPVLKSYGIEPDFVISIDPQPRIGEHFLGHEPGHALHVFSIVSPPELVRRYKGYISGNSHPVSQVIREFYPEWGSSIDSATGSVAGDALKFAILAGFKYIAMTGFDFSFSGNVIYARETAYQKRYSLFFSSRFRTSETFNAQYIFKSSGSLIAEGRYTRRSFIGYRNSLDVLISANNTGNVFMINKRGLHLTGPVYTDFDTFITMPGSINNDKREYLRDLSMKSDFFSFNVKKIRDTLINDRVLNEIIKESLGTDCTAEKKQKILSVIKAMA